MSDFEDQYTTRNKKDPGSQPLVERSTASDTPVTPERLIDVLSGYQPLFVLSSALDLRIFAHINNGADSLSALKRATGTSERGLGMMMNALTALGFVQRSSGETVPRYRLAPDTQQFLVADKSGYLGEYIQFTAEHILEQWRHLTACVETGRPAVELDHAETGTSFWTELVDLLFPWNYPLAAIIGTTLQQEYPEAPLLLDVAAGSGVWSIAAAQANETMAVVAFDLPEVLERTRAQVRRFDLTDRFTFSRGNIRHDELGENAFEIAILGQICHFEGASRSRQLFAKVARALRPGGTIVVIDMLLDEDKTGPLFTVLYNLTMLVSTSNGATFSFADYRSWLEEAGFREVRVVQALGQKVIMATSPG